MRLIGYRIVIAGMDVVQVPLNAFLRGLSVSLKAGSFFVSPRMRLQTTCAFHTVGVKKGNQMYYALPKTIWIRSRRAFRGRAYQKLFKIQFISHVALD